MEFDKNKKWKRDRACDYCALQQTPVDQCTHYRGGKTKNDHASGAWKNRFSNREARP